MGSTGSTHDTVMCLMCFFTKIKFRMKCIHLIVLKYNEESNFVEIFIQHNISPSIFHSKTKLFKNSYNLVIWNLKNLNTTMLMQQVINYREKLWKIWNILINFFHIFWVKFISKWHTEYFLCYMWDQRVLF